MFKNKRSSLILLFIGDLIVFYAALAAGLAVRYGLELQTYIDLHLMPFTVVAIIWFITFYAGGLYDPPRLRNNFDFIKTFSLIVTLNTLLTIALFYLIPAFGIAPRATLFLFLMFYVVIELLWRRFFNNRLSIHEKQLKVLLIGENAHMHELAATLRTHPQLGYSIQGWVRRELEPEEAKLIQEAVARHEINIVVIPHESKQDVELARVFYNLLTAGVAVYDLPSFYEVVFGRIPVADLSETWFLEHLHAERLFYDDLKRAMEFTGGVVLSVLLFPLLALVALLIKITSPGPVIYSQTRVGYGNRPFTLYKFRTMRIDAEKSGAQWAQENDPRVTFIGKILRHTHLDELPQLWNILRGEVSFVGPRPERPELVKVIEKEVPYFNIRHLVPPGITGWAQINYRYGASIDDSREKLEHDLYYLKNRSPILDIAIVLRTLKSFLIKQK
ncbi:MAG: sugar transferase [Anaplasmataceae bacterium]|nr:sugar transferase [Anaplasmataceae bacterium]